MKHIIKEFEKHQRHLGHLDRDRVRNEALLPLLERNSNDLKEILDATEKASTERRKAYSKYKTASDRVRAVEKDIGNYGGNIAEVHASFADVAVNAAGIGADALGLREYIYSQGIDELVDLIDGTDRVETDRRIVDFCDNNPAALTASEHLNAGYQEAKEKIEQEDRRRETGGKVKSFLRERTAATTPKGLRRYWRTQEDLIGVLVNTAEDGTTELYVSVKHKYREDGLSHDLLEAVEFGLIDSDVDDYEEFEYKGVVGIRVKGGENIAEHIRAQIPENFDVANIKFRVYETSSPTSMCPDLEDRIAVAKAALEDDDGEDPIVEVDYPIPITSDVSEDDPTVEAHYPSPNAGDGEDHTIREEFPLSANKILGDKIHGYLAGYGKSKVETVVRKTVDVVGEERARALFAADADDVIMGRNLRNLTTKYFPDLEQAVKTAETKYEGVDTPEEYSVDETPGNFLPDRVKRTIRGLTARDGDSQVIDTHKELRMAFGSWDGNMTKRQKTALDVQGLVYTPGNPHGKIYQPGKEDQFVVVSGTPSDVNAGFSIARQIIRHLL